MERRRDGDDILIKISRIKLNYFLLCTKKKMSVKYKTYNSCSWRILAFSTDYYRKHDMPIIIKDNNTEIIWNTFKTQRYKRIYCISQSEFLVDFATKKKEGVTIFKSGTMNTFKYLG